MKHCLLCEVLMSEGWTDLECEDCQQWLEEEKQACKRCGCEEGYKLLPTLKGMMCIPCGVREGK